jgi:hypothetical protein
LAIENNDPNPAPTNAAPPTKNFKNCLRFSIAYLLGLRSEPCDEFGDEERKAKKGHREKDLERQKLSPVPGHPDLFYSAYKKSEDKGPHNNPKTCAEKVIPEPNLGESHPEIHGREGKINETQIKHRGKTVSLDRIVILP